MMMSFSGVLFCISALFLSSSSSTLVLPINFPDPCVILVDYAYHAFATNGNQQNIQHAMSYDMKYWTVYPDSLPELGRWAYSGLTWAPYVFRTRKGFTMWYTAHDVKTNRQCIGVAKSFFIDGTFVDDYDRPLVCPDNTTGAIDAYMYTEGPHRYLLYSTKPNDGVSSIWIQETNYDGDQLMGSPKQLIQVDRDWENGVNEAPTLRVAETKYVLFYSASSFVDEKYCTNYALADNLTGPYVKADQPFLTTEKMNKTVIGPGGEDVITGKDGKDYIIYHGWDKQLKKRMLYVNHLEWNKDLPVLGADV